MTNKEFLEDFKLATSQIFCTLENLINVIIPYDEDDKNTIEYGKSLLGDINDELSKPDVTISDLNTIFDMKAVRENWDELCHKFVSSDRSKCQQIIDILQDQMVVEYDED